MYDDQDINPFSLDFHGKDMHSQVLAGRRLLTAVSSDTWHPVCADGSTGAVVPELDELLY